MEAFVIGQIQALPVTAQPIQIVTRQDPTLRFSSMLKLGGHISWNNKVLCRYHVRNLLY